MTPLTPAAVWLRATRAFGVGWQDDPLRRMAATRRDPLLFALLYLPHHLRGDETGGAITFSEAHLDWASMAKRWMEPLPTDPEDAERDGIIAPRGMGKSTWWFLALPLWAACHGHVRFLAAFADSATQAETHLATFRHELEKNALIRADYPLLCKPAVDARGALVADRDNQYQATSGFIFAARGVDTSSLGLKVEDARPDLLILDDIEPAEAKYSGELAKKRLGTIQDAILPLNVFARVVLVGTVTMPGSIVHQLVKVAKGRPDDSTRWVAEERIIPHYYPAIAVDERGEERSTWPEKWPLAFLVSIRHTRQYAKNYANDPMGYDGDYWRSENFVHVGDEALDGVVRTLLSIDPAVTSKKSSDETGLAVIGHDPGRARCVVKRVAGVRLPPKDIRILVLKWLRDDPTIGAVLVETNQGGDTWKAILHDLPVRVLTKHQTVKKEVRAANVLTRYERGRVVHLEHGPGIDRAEEQMLGFPKADHDDLVDAVGTGVAYFLMRKKRPVSSATSGSYI